MSDDLALSASRRVRDFPLLDDAAPPSRPPALPAPRDPAAIAWSEGAGVSSAMLLHQRPAAAASKLATSAGDARGALPPLPVADGAYRGIRVLSLADDLPKSDGADPSRKIAAGAYRLYPQTTTRPDGTRAVTHYLAYNVETKRNELAVGPASVDAVRAQPRWFQEAAALAYAQGEPKTAWEKESMRAMDALMREGAAAGLAHFAAAWSAAVRDPGWWGRAVSAALTSPVVLETGAPLLGRLPSRAARVVDTATAKLGMASPLKTAAELQPLSAAERDTTKAYLLKNGCPPGSVDPTLDGLASGVRIETLSQDLQVVRYSGGQARPSGRWFTEKPVRDPIRDLALPAKENSAEYLDTWVIPKGTTVLRSPVAPLNGQPGGATQILLSDMGAARGASPATGILIPGMVSSGRSDRK